MSGGRGGIDLIDAGIDAGPDSGINAVSPIDGLAVQTAAPGTSAAESVPQFAAPLPPIPRGRGGRPKLPDPDGVVKDHARPSVEAGLLADGTALRTYLLRNLALGLARNRDVLNMIAVLDPDQFDTSTPEGATKRREQLDALDELIETASDRVGGTAKARWGTAMHALTEPGAPKDWTPPEMVPDVTAYWRELERTGIRRVESEVFVINDEHTSAGSCDGVFDVPGWGRLVGDVKTGKLHGDQCCVQLSHYASAKRFDRRTGERSELGVRQDVALIIHLPKGEGRCELFLVDLDLGRWGIEITKAIRGFRSADGGLRHFEDAAPHPEVAGLSTSQAVEALYGHARSRVILGAGDDYAQASAEASAEPGVMHEGERVDTTTGEIVSTVQTEQAVTAVAYCESTAVTDTVQLPEPEPVPQLVPEETDAELLGRVLGARELTLDERISEARTRGELNALWAQYAPLGQWLPEHHALAAARAPHLPQ